MKSKKYKKNKNRLLTNKIKKKNNITKRKTKKIRTNKKNNKIKNKAKSKLSKKFKKIYKQKGGFNTTDGLATANMGTAGLAVGAASFNPVTTPLKLTKWINPAGEAKLTSGAMEKKIVKAGQLATEGTAGSAAAEAAVMEGKVAPCTNSIPGAQAQLASLGCSLLEGTALDLLQHGVSGQTIGSSPNLDYHNNNHLK